MANEYVIPIITKEDLTIGGVVYAIPVLQTLGTFKLVNVDTAAEINGTHLGDGYWSFGTVPDGNYSLYNGESKIIWYGTRWIGDDSLNYVGKTGNETIDGMKDFIQRIAYSANGVSITSNREIPHKAYVDTQDATKVNKTGDTMSGMLEMGTNKIRCTTYPLDNNSAVNMSALKTYALQSTGGTMYGAIDMGGFDITNVDNITSRDITTSEDVISGRNLFLTGLSGCKIYVLSSHYLVFKIPTTTQGDYYYFWLDSEDPSKGIQSGVSEPV